jgi:hypothetical protein
MIDAVVRSMLGTWGAALLDFYIANSLWINGLALAYALLVVFARRNYDLSLNSLLSSLKNKYGNQLQKKGAGTVLEMVKKADLPWDDALGRSKIPFLTPPRSIRLYRKNRETLQKLVTPEKLAELLKAE